MADEELLCTKPQIDCLPVDRVLGQLVHIPIIDRDYSEGEVIRLRDHLLEIGKRFKEANPDTALVHYGNTKGERKKQRRRTKKNP